MMEDTNADSGGTNGSSPVSSVYGSMISPGAADYLRFSRRRSVDEQADAENPVFAIAIAATVFGVWFSARPIASQEVENHASGASSTAMFGITAQNELLAQDFLRRTIKYRP